MGLLSSFKNAPAAKPPLAGGGSATVSHAGSVESIKGSGSPVKPPLAQEKRVLFVGGDPLWFSQIERDLPGLQPAWVFKHADTSANALQRFSSETFHALILDGTVADGGHLLKALELELAHCTCLVRCRTLDRAAATQWKGSGATLVAESADAGTLVADITRCERIRDWMADPSIKKLVSQIHKLPAQPRLHAEVTQELQSPSSSMEVVGRLISQDPVMSAKILQVVNSAFFGLAREVSDTTEAVMELGAERIKGLILLAGIFSQYEGNKRREFSSEPIWAHSVQVSTYARAIALAETRNVRTAEAAFTAGLLHDIGKLVLAGNLPEMYDTINRLKASKRITHREAEMEIIGASHAELGACLLATWGLPLPILEAIAWHHDPARSDEKGFSLLAAVHAANVFTQENDGGDGPRDLIHTAYLIHAGLGDCRNRWREVCGLEPKENQETTGGV